jgi:hypothetical protein
VLPVELQVYLGQTGSVPDIQQATNRYQISVDDVFYMQRTRGVTTTSRQDLWTPLEISFAAFFVVDDGNRKDDLELKGSFSFHSPYRLIEST